MQVGPAQVDGVECEEGWRQKLLRIEIKLHLPRPSMRGVQQVSSEVCEMNKNSKPGKIILTEDIVPIGKDKEMIELAKEIVFQNGAILRMNEQTLNMINNPVYSYKAVNDD